MRPFEFRLDRILKYRKYLEKVAQVDLSNARHEYMKSEEEIQMLARKRIEIAKKCSDEGFKGIVVPMYQIYQAFLKKLDHNLERAHISLKEREEKVIAQEAVLKKESIKKKTLDTLKDLQYKEFMKNSEREEQKVLDEIVVIERGQRI